MSPNEDGVSDELVVAARLSENASAVLTIRNAGGSTVKTLSATNDIVRIAWDLRAGGEQVPDGDYTWTLKAADTWGNPAVTRSGEFTVDSTPPVSSATREGTAGENGWLVSPATVQLTSRDAESGVKFISWRVNEGPIRTYTDPVTVTEQGVVTFEYRATDRAGIRESWRKVTLRIDTREPLVTFEMTGREGDVAGTWRGPVTIAPTVRDPASGVATKRYAIDGADSEPLGSEPIVVSGNGEHTVTVTATDEAGNRQRVSETFSIDTRDPVLELVGTDDQPRLVTPNGDGTSESVTIPFTVSEPGAVTASIAGPDAVVVRTLRLPVAEGAAELTWDGRTSTGAPVPDGAYTVTLTPRDAAGNSGAPVMAGVDVYAALAGVSRTPTLFFPQDGDRLAQKTLATWTLLSPAAVTIRVLDLDWNVVRTGPAGRADAAGAGSWAWNGRDDAGQPVARGVYRVEVTATNGVQSASQNGFVRADAFRVDSSVVTAVRGRPLVITAVSAEPLSGAPKLIVRQPGMANVTLVMTKASPTRWTATVTPRRAGGTGTLVLTVKGVDTRDGVNATHLRLPLQ